MIKNQIYFESNEEHYKFLLHLLIAFLIILKTYKLLFQLVIVKPQY